MTEENEKQESMVTAAGINPHPQDQTLITNIKAGKAKGLQTYEVYWLVPETDEEAQSQYNCTLKDLVTQGVRNLSTRPAYNLEFDGDELDEAGHANCQDLADNYKCGQKVAGVAKEAKEINEMRKEAKLTMAEMKDAIRLHREQLDMG